MMRHIFFSIYIILFFSSCRKEVKIKLPDTDSKPVVYCYISPNDSIIEARITKSSPLFKTFDEKDFEPQKNAVVTISSQNSTQTLVFDNSSLTYRLSSKLFPIVHGVNYTLRVKLSDGTTVEAETKVPSKEPEIKGARMLTQAVNSATILNVYIKYLDDISEKNNYCLFINQLDTINSDTIRRAIEFREFANDIGIEGRESEIKIGLFDQVSINRSPGFDCYLISCSNEYFSFYNKINYYTGNNPFSEPSPAYSNIKGGHGVFASYSMSKIQILK